MLRLKFTEKGFVVWWYRTKYFEYFGEKEPFKYPYEKPQNIFNYVSGTYVTDTTFSRIIADMLNNRDAYLLFWKMIRKYTDYEP